MTWLILAGMAVAGLFAFVLIFGAPYLPTLRAQTDEALDMLGLEPGDTLLELGSGDGRVLKAAARRGIRGIGYELNPLLVVVSWFVLFRYRKLARVQLRNFWKVKLPEADGIYLFLLDRFMARMDAKLKAEVRRPTKVVSYAFTMPDTAPVTSHKALTLYEYGSVDGTGSSTDSGNPLRPHRNPLP